MYQKFARPQLPERSDLVCEIKGSPVSYGLFVQIRKVKASSLLTTCLRLQSGILRVESVIETHHVRCYIRMNVFFPADSPKLVDVLLGSSRTTPVNKNETSLGSCILSLRLLFVLVG